MLYLKRHYIKQSMRMMNPSIKHAPKHGFEAGFLNEKWQLIEFEVEEAFSISILPKGVHHKCLRMARSFRLLLCSKMINPWENIGSSQCCFADRIAGKYTS